MGLGIIKAIEDNALTEDEKRLLMNGISKGLSSNNPNRLFFARDLIELFETHGIDYKSYGNERKNR